MRQGNLFYLFRVQDCRVWLWRETTELVVSCKPQSKYVYFIGRLSLKKMYKHYLKGIFFIFRDVLWKYTLLFSEEASDILLSGNPIHTQEKSYLST